MANEKILNTRIQLKYDSYENWIATANQFKLRPGEVAVVNINGANGANLNNGVENTVVQPTILFKVGIGDSTDNTTWKTFNQLPWASGLAADVYTWAKKATPDWTDFPALPLEVVDTGTGKFVTDVTYANNKLTITRSDVAVADIADFDDAVHTVLADDYLITPSVAGDGSGRVLGTNIGGDLNVSRILSGNQIVANSFTVLDGSESLSVATENYVDTKVGNIANIDVNATTKPTDIVGAINTVRDELEAAINVGGTGSVVTITPTTANEETSYEVKQGKDSVGTITVVEAYKKSEVDQLISDAKKYANDNDANTAHTHKGGLGTIVNDEGGIDATAEVEVNLNLAFEKLTIDNKIRLVDASSNALVAEFDAAEFVKDSFLKSASYNDDTNDLTFVFVDKDGNENSVPVALDDLVDIYVGDETTITLTTSGDGKVFKIKDGGVGTAQLATGAVTTEKIAKDAVTEAKLDEDVRDALDLARSALQESDISNKANKITTGTPGNIVVIDSDGDIQDSGYNATAFQPAGNYVVNTSGTDTDIKIAADQNVTIEVGKDDKFIVNDETKGNIITADYEGFTYKGQNVVTEPTLANYLTVDDFNDADTDNIVVDNKKISLAADITVDSIGDAAGSTSITFGADGATGELTVYAASAMSFTTTGPVNVSGGDITVGGQDTNTMNLTAGTVGVEATSFTLNGNKVRTMADKITSDDFADEIFIFNCGTATEVI